MGWEDSDVLEILNDSVDASFAPKSQKEKVRKDIKEQFSQRKRLTQLNFDFRDRVHYD